MPDLTVDLRKMAKSITITVQYKNLLWVRFGFWLIKIGARISGAELIDEFPMSLIQPEQAKEKFFAGMPIILDPDMPRDEIKLLRGNQ